MAKDKGESVYIEKGDNRWSAVHRADAAVLYRMIIEQQPGQKVFHAVAETGIPFRLIAEAIGNGLHISTVSKTAENAKKHFTWFTHFASLDCRASSDQTRSVLGWNPKEVTLLDDLSSGGYF
jgi:nucleoside-diphosphate-sugar epimerase